MSPCRHVACTLVTAASYGPMARRRQLIYLSKVLRSTSVDPLEALYAARWLYRFLASYSTVREQAEHDVCNIVCIVRQIKCS